MDLAPDKKIEVEVTAEDIEKMRADGVSDDNLPEIGIKCFRPARHVLKDKVARILVVRAD